MSTRYWLNIMSTGEQGINLFACSLSEFKRVAFRTVSQNRNASKLNKMVRVTEPQMYVLLDFLEKHPQLAKGVMSRGLEARHNVKRLWYKLAALLNNMQGVKKTPKRWSKFWAEKKCSVKKNAQIRDFILSDIDKRILLFCLEKKADKREISPDSIDHGEEASMNGHRSEEVNNVDYLTKDRTEFKDRPPSFAPDMEERQINLMEKLVVVMNQQSSALIQLAQASSSQASAMERLAEASHIQARAVERLASSFESIGSAAHGIRNAVVDIDLTMKRFYNTLST